MNPPATLVIQWCPVCGRHDRAIPFVGKFHWSRCKGEPTKVVYLTLEGEL